MIWRRALAVSSLLVLCVVAAGGAVAPASAQSKPEGEMRFALYVTLAPVWFDPGESVVGVITPF